MVDWYVMWTKPHREQDVCRRFAQQGIVTYLPMLAPTGRRRKPSPLFPRYLFARLEAGSCSSDVWSWTPGLSAAVRVGEAYATVPDTVIERIKAGLLRMEERPCPFSRGDRVRVVGDHPLAMLDAVFDKPLSGGARAQILIELLGRLTRCSVETRDLVRVSAPGWAFAQGA